MKMVEGAEHLVSDGKKTFIRPEQLIITASDTSRTIIREENFQGMFTFAGNSRRVNDHPCKNNW
jgi:hypothetical protein